MAAITREQRLALKRVYDRCPLNERLRQPILRDERTISYREFRRHARYDVFLDCVMVYWCGMWLGVEADGYTHS